MTQTLYPTKQSRWEKIEPLIPLMVFLLIILTCVILGIKATIVETLPYHVL